MNKTIHILIFSLFVFTLISCENNDKKEVLESIAVLQKEVKKLRKEVLFLKGEVNNKTTVKDAEPKNNAKDVDLKNNFSLDQLAKMYWQWEQGDKKNSKEDIAKAIARHGLKVPDVSIVTKDQLDKTGHWLKNVKQKYSTN